MLSTTFFTNLSYKMFTYFCAFLQTTTHSMYWISAYVQFYAGPSAKIIMECRKDIEVVEAPLVCSHKNTCSLQQTTFSFIRQALELLGMVWI